MATKPMLSAARRRLKHLKGVYGRNFQADQLVTTYFQIIIGYGNSRDTGLLIYESEAIENTLNPSWNPLEDVVFSVLNEADHAKAPPNIAQTTKEIKIVVYKHTAPRRAFVEYSSENNNNKNNNDNISTSSKTGLTDTVLFEKHFDFEKLIFIGNALEQCDSVPLNTILLEFSDGVFVCPSIALQMGIIWNEVYGLPLPNTYDDETYLDPSRKRELNSAALLSSRQTPNQSAANIKKSFAQKKIQTSPNLIATLGRNATLMRNRSTSTAEKVDMKNDINLEEIKNCVVNIVSLKYAIDETYNDIAELHDKATELMKKQETHRRKIHTKEIYRSRIRQLQQELSVQKAKLQNEKDAVAKEKSELLPRGEKLFEALAHLNLQQKVLAESSEELHVQRESLNILDRKCQERRRKIVKLLKTIYPVTPSESDPKRLVIAGLSVYKRDTLGTDDEAATALGYIAHCVLIISKLYQIQLKHLVFPMASRSFIKAAELPDNASQSSSSSGPQQQPMGNFLPLFMARGTEKAKYLRAVILLNRNIIQILKSIGYQVRVSRDLLINLRYIMEYPPYAPRSDNQNL